MILPYDTCLRQSETLIVEVFYVSVLDPNRLVVFNVPSTSRSFRDGNPNIIHIENLPPIYRCHGTKENILKKSINA